MDTTPGLDGFPLRTTDTLRFSDCDMQGHVNNAVYATFFETGRVDLIARAHAAAEVSGCEFVIARLIIDYLQEVRYPGTVTVGTRITRIGNSSLTCSQDLVVDGEVRARAESTIVQISTATRRSEPFSPQLRSYLESLT